MAQADYFIANQSGALVRQDINEQLEAIATLNEGVLEPPIKFPRMLWYDAQNDKLKQRNGENTEWLDFSAMSGAVPIGSIVAYIPGHFTNAANGGFTHKMVSGNTSNAVNELLNPSGWHVCNGAALEDPLSPIFDGAGRNLPNLTDDRFLMGDTLAGGIGGANSNNIAHTHTTGNFALTVSHMPSHSHSIGSFYDGTSQLLHITALSGIASGTYCPAGGWTNGDMDSRMPTWFENHHAHSCGSVGSGAAHNHGSTGSTGTSSLENRPKYLSCFYIMRVR